MISGVRGRIVAKLPGIVLVDLHGLTLRVLTSQTTVSDIGDVGQQVELVTHLRVREDDISLFGFAVPEELQLFEVLLTVSGVGPRVALNILSSGRPDDVHRAIASEDVAALSRVPGIGKKTASRIILELRGKLPEATGGGMPALASIDAEVLEALQALGYSGAEARDALAHVERREGQSAEERIYATLQALSR
ncbi:MAG TPA: Holliday junction branch migration protein RuvA [Thermomicrobiaceae bacterium]|nr:Holliday junction branch migration protein RuvA [Thermomicrobiaceae bacterium]